MSLKRKNFSYINMKILGLVVGLLVVGVGVILMHRYGVLFNQEAGVLINWSTKEVTTDYEGYEGERRGQVTLGVGKPQRGELTRKGKEEPAGSKTNTSGSGVSEPLSLTPTFTPKPITIPNTSPRSSMEYTSGLSTYVVEGGEMYIAEGGDEVTEVFCSERVCYTECPEYEIVRPNGQRDKYIDHGACREVCEWRDCR